MIASAPDLLRLALVLPFVWVAILDFRTRRVPRWIWWPIGGLGALALVWTAISHYPLDGLSSQIWIIQVGLSLGIVAPLGYLFYRVGAFGGADAKAVIAMAIVYPTYPAVHVASLSLPLVEAPLGVFSLTVLVNGVLLGLLYPFGLALGNVRSGHFRPAMFIGKPVHWSGIEAQHGVLLENSGGFTRHGLDLDALRMYLRWRETDLASLRSDPAHHREPASLPNQPSPPGDGRVRADGGTGGTPEDQWGARAFVKATESPYGTRPEELREGMELLTRQEAVWVSPGIPFLVLLTTGLILGLVVGDAFTALLAGIGGQSA